MLQDIGTNILSDLIFIALAIILAWLYYLVTKRRQLLNFFGIKQSKRIIIYLSNLYVHSGGSTGIDELPRSFQGKAITNEEAKAANQLQSLFNYFLPSWGDKPGILSKLLIADIVVQIEISPLSVNEIEQSSSFISLGSFAYNAASGYLDKRSDALGKCWFVPVNNGLILDSDGNSDILKNSRVTVTGIKSENQHGGFVSPSGVVITPPSSSNEQGNSFPTGIPVEIPPIQPLETIPGILVKNKAPVTDPRVGYLERIYDHEKQRSLFCAAGISELATVGCVYYLKSKWQELNKKYGATESFLILLRFDSDDKHPIVLDKIPD